MSKPTTAELVKWLRDHHGKSYTKANQLKMYIAVADGMEAAESTINRQKGALQNDREECEALGRERDEAEQTIKALESEIKDAEHDISSYMDINKGLLNDMPCPACELRELLKQGQES